MLFGGLIFASATAASGPSLVTIYSFCAQSNCTDGMFPSAPLLVDEQGNLFGTTLNGGSDFEGTVFELMPNKGETSYTETVLHSFCPSTKPCPGQPAEPDDGAHPSAGLIKGVIGNLIGTTLNHGGHQGGAIFELTPQVGTFGAEFIEYSFCSFGGVQCTDGIQPAGDVIDDGRGNLFTTTQQDGNGGGTVFEHRLDGQNLILYNFCTLANCADGKQPVAGLVRGSADRLFGTTFHGGANLDAGTVFELSLKTLHEKVLHNFCADFRCTDGAFPEAPLIMDGQGNLYGTTASGGEGDGGTVFELVASQGYKQIVLYSFCRTGTCPDGASPVGALLRDGAGNLFGTTGVGGNLAVNSGSGFGAVFELVRGTSNRYTEKILYSFCSQPNCTDGALPEAGLVRDEAGFLYGTTKLGGIIGAGGQSNGGGTVFKLKP